MQIVIDIPEKIYKYVQQIGSINMIDTQQVANAIFDGTPLPKGHGRLIDVSDIEWAKFTRETSRYEEAKCVDWDVVENAPTIIEASE